MGRIVGIDDLNQIDLTSKPLAVAVGYKENILNKFGYGLIDDELIIEDILYDNKHLNPDSMCIERFKSLSKTRLLPVFKYVKGASAAPEEGSKLKTYIDLHNSYDKIIAKNTTKKIKNVAVFNDFDDLIDSMNDIADINKKAGLLLKNIQSLSISQIREGCKNIFSIDRDVAVKSTHFKRCVMYLDLMENYSKEKSQ